MSSEMVDHEKTRLPRRRRALNPPSMQITDRDVAIVSQVLKYRFLTTTQVLWLFPGGSPLNLKVRLRYLFHHAYLNRVSIPVATSTDPFIYSMTEKGAQLLAEHLGVDRAEVKWQRHLNVLQPTHIKHLLAINDILISLQLALAAVKGKADLADFRIIRGDPKKHKLTVQLRDLEGRRSEASVIPDAILVIQTDAGENGVLFIEVDRGTMQTSRWQEKILAYREYSQSGLLSAAWRSQWSIILTVTSSKKRLLSLAEKTVAAGGRRGYWFTTSGEITPDTALASHWVRGTDLFQLRNENVSKLAEIGQAKHLSMLDALRFDNG